MSIKVNLLQTEYKPLQKSGVSNSPAFYFLINPGLVFARLIFNWIWVPFVTVCTPEHTPEHKRGTVLLKWKNPSWFGSPADRAHSVNYICASITLYKISEHKVIWILCSPTLDRILSITHQGTPRRVAAALASGNKRVLYRRTLVTQHLWWVCTVSCPVRLGQPPQNQLPPFRSCSAFFPLQENCNSSFLRMI